MCEQTKAYDDGDIVWVKLSNCWWPGEVCEEARLPADLVASLKKPLAVVKFFQEDSYEYVKNINNIFKYQCSRKMEFIRKGLELHKTKRKYMEKFPADVGTAEKLTGGDVDIVKTMQMSPQKSSPSVWSDVFADTKAKKGKKTPTILSPLKKGRRSLKSPRKTTPPLTKTFLGKAREHEVRFLGGSSTSTRTSTDSSSGLYKCHACPFSCNRINVIVLHSKTHTTEAGSCQTKQPTTTTTTPKSKTPKRATPKIPTASPEIPSEDETPKVVQRKPRTRTPVVRAPPKKRGKRKLSETVDESPAEVVQEVEKPEVKISPEVKQPVKKRKTDLEWKNELLADWSEDEEPGESSESNLSQEKDQKEESPEKVQPPAAEAVVAKKVPVVEEKKEEVKSTPIKYRNIPKKDRRDIVLESGELLEVNRPTISAVSAPIPDTVPQKVPVDAGKVEMPSPAAPPVEPSIEMPTRRSSRRKAKVSTSEDEDSWKGGRPSSPKKSTEKQTKENPQRESPKKEIPEAKATDGDSAAAAAVIDSPPKTISCFDFQEDEEDVVLDSITKHRQKKLHASDQSSGSRKSWELSKEVDSARDEKLNSDIESLLKATILPRIPDAPKTFKYDPEAEQKETTQREIALPPKERGKRIFKSKNRSKSNSSEVEEDKKSPRGKSSRESTEDEKQSNKGHSPSKDPTESDLQIAQTLINLPDHTPPLPTVKETGNSRKNDFDFSASKETNAAEVLMNLGNLTETRTSPTKHEEKKSKGAGNREYSSSGKSCPPAQTKIKLPDNVTVTKVVKPPQSSPNHTKNLTEGRQVDGQSENSERVKLKKVVPKKRKPNIDVTEEIVLHKAPEPKTVVTVPSPAASPKKIIKIKSQMKSPTQPACPKTEESVFDISNMPIVLTDDVLPVRTVEKYSVIVPEGKTSATTSKSPTTTTTSNGREQGRVLKGEEVVVSSKSALVKRIKLLGNQKERSGSSSPEVGSSAVHKLATERRLIKLPPKKEERKLPTTSIGVGSTVVLVPQSKVPGQPLSPTKIIYSSGSFSTAATTSAAANPPVTLKISKPQVIQGKSGGQIVITSKGKVITKQSDMITTTASKVTEVSTTFKMAEGSKMSANPAKLIIKSPAKIHVQSQEIIYKPPKEIAAAKTTASLQPPKAVEVVGKADGESQKKVLRRIKRPRRLEIVDHTASHSGTNTQTIVVQEVPPLAPITTESLTSNCVKKVVSTAASDDAATTLRLKTSAPKSPVKSNKQTEKIESGSSVKAGSGSTDVTRAVAATREKSEKVTMAAEGPGLCPSLPNPESTSNIQDSQLLAIPGESFGGPANSFFLCTLENGTFTPIDNQPLYLDASNQLVPHPPEASAAGGGESDAEQQGQDAIVELQESDQIVVESDVVSSDGAETKYVLSTGNGQQILLDQQSLLAIAAGDMQRLVTPEGQELILQGSSQDILSSITLNQTELGILTDGQQIIVPDGMANSPNQDILAAALAGTEVFPQDNLIADVPQIPAANPAQVSETNAVLTQPPIMSTLEVPTKTEKIAPKVTLESGFSAQNLDDSLAVIGVKGHQTNVPTSLELPITVTNPAIAPKTTKSPMSLTSIYLPPVTTTASQISPSIPIVEEIFSAANNVLDLYQAGGEEDEDQATKEVEVETTEKVAAVEALDEDIIEETAVDETSGEVDSINGNDIVPVTPESLTNHEENPTEMSFNEDDGNSSHSSEIPIQPDLILRPEDFTQDDPSDTPMVGEEECEATVSHLLENLTTTNSVAAGCADSMNQNSSCGNNRESTEDMS
ncbi:titin homolog isoform X2 [Lutzomyia longipalpis]|uniref:titin homolog isoform X2 n=1 Tax=Lutzomyia longipalpis TaxID=7200 RepID=UPI002483444B|nr:titin homolog isoform X2 [Lutzomyia longipalpis]